MQKPSIENSDQIYDAVEHIATQRGNSQQDLIEFYLLDDYFMKVCKAALDPFVTYGIKQVPERKTKTETGDFMADYEFSILKDLANRDLTGNAARDCLQVAIDNLSAKSAELFSRIIKKDLRASFSAKAVNKAVPNSIYTFECMLAHKFEEKRISFPIAVEPKFDGVRVLAIVRDGQAKMFSRTGKEFPNYDHIGQQLVTLIEASPSTCKDKEWLFDGEVMDGDFLNTVGSMRRSGEDATGAVFHVFEFMTMDDFMRGSADSHAVRRARMNELFANAFRLGVITASIKRVESKIARNLEDIMIQYSGVRATGGEGVIVKPLSGLYERKRSHAWLKIKAEESADLIISDFFEGEGKYEGKLGGFTVSFNGVSVNVGSGLSDNDRDFIWRDLEGHRGRLIQVDYHEVTPDGSLRHPRFVRFRDDKPISDGMGV